MRNILFGGALTILLLLLVALVVTKVGLMPVSADGAHSRLEARIMPAVLHASIVHHASNETNPIALNEDNLKAGVDTYKAMCARCHGTPDSESRIYGQSFYPAAPKLPEGMASYTDAQLFWLIKHGIRNTGMPAWGSMLSDEEIWQVVSLLKNSGDVPASIEAEWGAKKTESAR